jgi:TRAP-type C4-dicarboxylate transport system permease small subunit
MDWLFPIVTALVAVLTLFLSKPEKRVTAWITVVLIVITGGWQAYSTYQQIQTQQEIRSHVHGGGVPIVVEK